MSRRQNFLNYALFLFTGEGSEGDRALTLKELRFGIRGEQGKAVPS
jgi:hypothetical protein